MSKKKAEELRLSWIAEIGAHGVVAGPDNSLQEQPAEAAKAALAKEGLSVEDVDLFELNEAFAAVGIASTKALGVDPAKINPNGGAIALGHPIGATGCLLTVKAMYELQRTGGRYGLITMCIGGGQGIAAIYERMH
jgi:acetyl-CoA C-acetyltransferase